MSAARERIAEVLREFGHEEDGGGWVLFADNLGDIADAVLAAGFVQVVEETNREHYYGDAADVWVDRP